MVPAVALAYKLRMAPYTVRPMRPRELADCIPLAAGGLGFRERDQIPPWLMHTTGLYGGIALGAFATDRLVGYSYALPGFDGRPFLLSCGLVVRPEHRGRGVGEALKRAQADAAREAGYDSIRWTTGSLAREPLRLYLSKLGARLVRVRAEMYSEVRPVALCDEVEIEWALAADASSAGGTSSDLGSAHCGLETKVEIPWRRRFASEAEARRWVRRVREQMGGLLAAGFVGTAVDQEPEHRRCFVVFQREAS